MVAMPAGERRAEVDQQFVDIEARCKRLERKSGRLKRKQEELGKQLIWVAEGSNAQKALYLQQVEARDAGAWWKVKELAGPALLADIKPSSN